MFSAGRAAHCSHRLGEVLLKDADHNVAFLDRQIFVDTALHTLFLNAGTAVGLPAEHFELHLAFVANRCNVSDVTPLSGNFFGRGDEYGSHPATSKG